MCGCWSALCVLLYFKCVFVYLRAVYTNHTHLNYDINRSIMKDSLISSPYQFNKTSVTQMNWDQGLCEKFRYVNTIELLFNNLFLRFSSHISHATTAFSSVLKTTREMSHMVTCGLINSIIRSQLAEITVFLRLLLFEFMVFFKCRSSVVLFYMTFQ